MKSGKEERKRGQVYFSTKERGRVGKSGTTFSGEVGDRSGFLALRKGVGDKRASFAFPLVTDPI